MTWIVCLAAGHTALAQNQRLTAAQQEGLRSRLNESTLIVATNHATSSQFAMAQDIGAAIAKGADLRLLPVPSRGGTGTLHDLLWLRGVDMAVVPANVLAQAKAGEGLGPGLAQRIAYITRLYAEEVHLLVGRNVTALKELRGKKIAVPLEDGDALFTGNDLFIRYGVGVDIEAMPAADALEQVRSGRVAALLLMVAKPSPLVAGIPKDGSIRLLGLPLTQAMEDGYSPVAFRAEDYPTLIPEGLVVESVAVSAVLVAHNAKATEETARRTASFVPAFFDAVSQRSLVDRRDKWREVNLAGTLRGWPRLPAAEEWLRRAQQEQALSLKRSFEDFLHETQQPGAPPLSATERKKLFDAFVDWTRKSVNEADVAGRR